MSSYSVIHLICLRNNRIILSKKHYNDLCEIQDRNDNYMKSFIFENCDELIGFISEEYGLSDFPFSEETVLRFVLSGETVIGSF